MSNTLRRRSPRRSTSSRSSTRRGASRSASVVPGRPFHGMSAAVRWCSTRRAYGRCVGHSTAIRSNGVPARAASTMRRMASRTSSSASVVDTIATGRGARRSVRRSSSTPVSAAPSASRSWRVSASAVGSPVSCATMRTSICSPSARTNVIARPGNSSGRCSTRLRSPSGAPARDGVGGGGEQVGFVVPACFERGGDRRADANRLASPERLVAQAVRRRRGRRGAARRGGRGAQPRWTGGWRPHRRGRGRRRGAQRS